MTDECVRVLKPTGSLWVNLGDKYSGAQAQNTKARNGDDSARTWAQTNPKNTGIPAKSLMGLPWRYAIGCIDDLGLILRAEVVWSKPNGLPESVTDRVRRSHEQWFHFTKEPRYFAAVDEVREAHREPERSTGRIEGHGTDRAVRGGANNGFGLVGDKPRDYNPLGKLPGSVWSIPSEPLKVPEFMVLAHASDMTPGLMDGHDNAWRWMRHSGVDRSPWPRPEHDEPGPFLVAAPDHFAAFPQEWPRRIILGWSPSAYCTACDEPRRPVSDKNSGGPVARAHRHLPGYSDPAGVGARDVTYTITGYSCACDVTLAPTRPAVVLDPFGGTGTVAMVARALGRYPIHIDLSADYLRLARWRIYDSGHAAKSSARTNRERQGTLL